MARWLALPFAVALAVALPLGCGDDDDDKASCTPNQQNECACEDGHKGTQTCSASGTSYTDCSCSVKGDAGASGSGGSGGSAGSAGGAAGTTTCHAYGESCQDGASCCGDLKCVVSPDESTCIPHSLGP